MLQPAVVGLLLAFQASSAWANCLVTPIEIVDHSRSVGVPYASPADSGGRPTMVRALAWSPGAGTAARPTYAELIRASMPGVDAAGFLIARLRFYGATVDSSAVVSAVHGQSLCARSAKPTRPTGGLVLIAGAFPPVMYEAAGAALAARGITTVALMSASESALRLAINHFALLGWPVDRIALVGHGAGGPAIQMIAMSNAAVRGLVSLDGFEALNRIRHPGLTGDPTWRPGNLRAPVLHWRPGGHPDQDSTHHVAAARSALVQITLTGIEGRQWMTAPEVALAPSPLRNLIGQSGAIDQAIVTKHSVDFITEALAAGSVFDVAAFVREAQRELPGHYVATTRLPLPVPAIRTDGRLDEPVWRNTRTLPDASDTQLQVTEDCDYLYVAIVPQRPTPFITELFIGGLDGRKLLLHASASLCWVYGEAEVAAPDCNRSEAWWGASRTNQAGDGPTGEYVIAKRALGVARCASAAGLRIGALTGGWNRTTLYPAGADKAWPDTWGRITAER